MNPRAQSELELEDGNIIIILNLKILSFEQRFKSFFCCLFLTNPFGQMK